MRTAADAIGVKSFRVNWDTAEDINPIFTKFTQEGAQAVTISGDIYHFQQRKQISDAAIKHRIASIAPFREYADAGIMLSYGTNGFAQFRHAASYVDKILKGAKPGDLPIEQPATFELVINLKTAKALGLAIPHSVLVRADQVIE